MSSSRRSLDIFLPRALIAIVLLARLPFSGFSSSFEINYINMNLISQLLFTQVFREHLLGAKCQKDISTQLGTILVLVELRFRIPLRGLQLMTEPSIPPLWACAPAMALIIQC